MTVTENSGLLVCLENYSKGGYLEVVRGFIQQSYDDGLHLTLALNRDTLNELGSALPPISITYSTPVTTSASKNAWRRKFLTAAVFALEPLMITHLRQLYIRWKFRTLSPQSILITSGGLPGGVWLLPQLRWARIKNPHVQTTVWIHSMYSSGAYLQERLFLRQLEKGLRGVSVVAPSNAVIESISLALAAKFPGKERGFEGVVISNQLTAKMECATKRWTENELVVVCPGQLQPAKGQDILLEALISIRDSCPGVRVICFGGQSDDFALGLKKRAADFGLGGRFEIYPFVDGRCEIYSQAQLVVLPSVKLEAFGMVLLEAMSLGIPVLGSDIGGIPEVIGGELGVNRFTSGDWRALGAMIARVAHNPGAWAELSLHSETQYAFIAAQRESGRTVRSVVTGNKS